MSYWKFLTLTLTTALVASAAFAADVKVSGVHNCCGSCAKGINEALSKAGATNVKLEKTELSFSADDPQKAVDALYAAGYAGKLEGAKAPRSGAGQLTGKEIKLEGLHNCCGACTAAINKALAGIGKTDAKAGATTITVTAENDVKAIDVIRALRAAGFNAKVVK